MAKDFSNFGQADLRALGQRAKELRTAGRDGFHTQAEWAERAKVSTMTVSRIELGYGGVEEATLLAFCSRLGVNPRWLLYGEEPRYSDGVAPAPPAEAHRHHLTDNGHRYEADPVAEPQRVRLKRVALELSVAELAHELGIPEAALQQAEEGRKTLTGRQMARLDNLLLARLEKLEEVALPASGAPTALDERTLRAALAHAHEILSDDSLRGALEALAKSEELPVPDALFVLVQRRLDKERDKGAEP